MGPEICSHGLLQRVERGPSFLLTESSLSSSSPLERTLNQHSKVTPALKQSSSQVSLRKVLRGSAPWLPVVVRSELQTGGSGSSAAGH
jgi:hypothetical protein